MGPASKAILTEVVQAERGDVRLVPHPDPAPDVGIERLDRVALRREGRQGEQKRRGPERGGERARDRALSRSRHPRRVAPGRMRLTDPCATTNSVDDVLDENAILERIRAHLGGDVMQSPSPPAAADDLQVDVAALREAQDIYERPLRSQRRALGPALLFANRT